MNDIKLDSIVIRNDEIAFAQMDGEIVMMNVDTGYYYNLGKLGSVIWYQLEDAIEVKALVQNLMDSYQVCRKECEEDVIGFLRELKQEGLIIVK